MAVSIGFGGSFFKSRELRAVIGDENGEQTRYGGCGGAEAHDRSNCAPTKWRKSTQLSRSRRVLRTAGMGHEDQFPLRRLTARSVIRKRTVAATRGNGRDAPKTAVRQGGEIAPASIQSRPFGGKDRNVRDNQIARETLKP
jgi:hypothetical protein